MITFTLSPTSWLGSCRGEGLICQTFSELASVASQWKKRPVGKVSSPFKGLCDETTAEERQICRDMANIKGAGAKQAGEIPGMRNYGKIIGKTNAGLLVQHRSKQTHAFANSLPPAWSRVGNSFLPVTHQSSQLLGSLCCPSTGCKPATLPPWWAAVQALWNTGSDLEQKVKGDISAAFSWHLTFSYCSWNIRKPEGGYLLPEVWSIYCEASACCVCLWV